MRLFTCFLQLLAGLALPAVSPQVRRTPTSQPGSPHLLNPSTQSPGGSETTDARAGAAPPRMCTHSPGGRLHHVAWEETSGWAVPDFSPGVCRPWWGQGSHRDGREVSCLAPGATVALLKASLH